MFQKRANPSLKVFVMVVIGIALFFIFRKKSETPASHSPAQLDYIEIENSAAGTAPTGAASVGAAGLGAPGAGATATNVAEFQASLKAESTQVCLSSSGSTVSGSGTSDIFSDGSVGNLDDLSQKIIAEFSLPTPAVDYVEYRLRSKTGEALRVHYDEQAPMSETVRVYEIDAEEMPTLIKDYPASASENFTPGSVAAGIGAARGDNEKLAGALSLGTLERQIFKMKIQTSATQVLEYDLEGDRVTHLKFINTHPKSEAGLGAAGLGASVSNTISVSESRVNELVCDTSKCSCRTLR